MEEFVIPEELLVNIVVRLPIKDILRFKIVCKSWLKLISSSSDPYFITNYVRNSPFVLIFRAQGRNGNLSYSLLEFSGKGGGEEFTIVPIMSPKIPHHNSYSYSVLSLIGSCNCSIFILHFKRLTNYAIHRVYLFSPGSCSVKLVAEDRILVGNVWQYHKVGFIPSNNTYKLVRFIPGLVKAEKIEIFTVGLDENWRNLDDHPLLFCGVWSYEGLICFNGAYHWVSRERGDNNGKIFTFDLLEEKSDTGTRIPKPRGVSGQLGRVTILKECLSVTELSYFSGTMVIWRMREYGVFESWSKVTVLALKHTIVEKSRYLGLLPIAVLANGDVLFSDGSSSSDMCFYNLQEKRLIPINDHPGSSSRLYRIYENNYTYIPRFYT